jgi:type II secretory pathway predicted ATPase ExeA
MLALKSLLLKKQYAQARLARAVQVSPATIAQLLNHDIWPIHPPRDTLQASITAALATQNIAVTAAHFEPVPVAGETENHTHAPEGMDMLLQKQPLSPQARKHFGLHGDPFANDITQASDVFVSQDIRFVRETLWQHARRGGLLALVGESGSGKSTVVSDFRDRLQREGRDVLVIEPSVLYMEENDSKGKTLKSAAIVQAIIATVAPSVAPKRDAETRARQMQQLLTAGHRAGQRYVLLIEEAHCLPTATLKHLKRFAELKDGLAPLLSIVMVGQPELRQRLAVNNTEVREVAQRCDIVELPPLDSALAEYLKFKLARVGVETAQVVTPEGIDALRNRLTFARRTGSGKSAQMITTYVSLAYPLAVANALTAAMNLAASLGAPVVDADIVKEA